MATDFDPYRILQIPPDAGDDQVRDAYQRMNSAAWADGTNPEAAREIDVAYRILSDPEQRRAYDERRAEALARGPAEVRDFEPAEAPASAPPPRVPWRIGDMAMAIGVVIGGTLAASIPAVVVAESLIEGDQEYEDDPTALSIIIGASLSLQIMMFLAAWFFGPRKYNVSLAALGLRKPTRGGWLFPIGLWGSALAIVYVYFGILQLLGVEPDSDLPEEAFDNPGPLVIIAVLAMGFAPIIEEIFFRGFIFGGLQGRWHWMLAALASGLLFGSAHLGNPGAFYVVPPITGVGILFAWGYRWSGSLVAPIGAHFLFNSISILAGIATS
jgi:uncharacterized protein